MKISREEVQHVANLARLKISEAEINLFTDQLDDILKYADKLQSLNTDKVEPLTHVLPVRNVTRDDQAAHSLSREEALQNAPSRERGFFKVPRIID